MPSGKLPSYRYVPPSRPGVDATMRSCSSRRARLFRGGTYFRSRETGLQQNLLSVTVIQFSGPATAQPDGVCVVTNHAPSKTEQLEGPATASLLKVNLPYDEYVEIDQLDTPTPRARHYSISAQIGATPGQIGDDLPFSFSRVLSLPGKLTAKLTPGSTVFAPADRIVIKPRFRIHRLEAEMSEPSDPAGIPEMVWSIKKLRLRVNADNPWVEMLKRSGPEAGGFGGAPIPQENPADVQDPGSDADGLTPFTEAFLTGGDGLPESPNNEVTGPFRSIIHLNYGERHNGSLAELNVVYEWAGEDATSGSWVPY